MPLLGFSFRLEFPEMKTPKECRMGCWMRNPRIHPHAISTAGRLGTLGSFTAPCKPPATPPALLRGNLRNDPKFPHLQLPGETLFVMEQAVKSTAAPFSTLKTAEQGCWGLFMHNKAGWKLVIKSQGELQPSFELGTEEPLVTMGHSLFLAEFLRNKDSRNTKPSSPAAPRNAFHPDTARNFVSCPCCPRPCTFPATGLGLVQ